MFGFALRYIATDFILRKSDFGNAKTRFEPIQEAKNWSKTGLPKVAAVNAFGFGGINAHVVLEGYDMPKKIKF